DGPRRRAGGGRVPGSVRRPGFGILVLAALAACAEERPEGSAGVVARGGATTGGAGADAAPVEQLAGAPVTGGPAVAPPGRAPAGGGRAATAVQPPGPLTMDSLPSQPDAAEARRLAPEGARIFGAKGCTRCHTV